MASFFKKTPPESPILKKYMDMATKFQNGGILLIVLSILLHMIGHEKVMLVVLALFVPGALALIFGGSNLQPHNMIKAFAQQCAREPGPEIAEAFLEVMTRAKRVSLTKQSIRLIATSIAAYAASEEGDPEMARKLQETADKIIVKKFF